MTKTEAARALSIEEAEVRQVSDSPAGPIVQTTDGVLYVIVPEESPDADGKTGLMFLAAPHPRYNGPFPVYSQPREAGADEGEPVESASTEPVGPSASSPGEPPLPPSGNAKDVLAWVGNDPARARTALDAENAGQRRKSLTDALARLVSG